MIALQGYFDGDRFISSDAVRIPRYKRAIVTILDDPISPDQYKKAWQQFFSDINSSDEELIGEPERVSFNREFD